MPHEMTAKLRGVVLALSLAAAGALAQTNASPATATNAASPTLTLSGALRMALETDQRIAIARSEEKIGKIEFQQSRSAFGPKFDLQGSYSLSEESDPADEFVSRFNPSERWEGIFKVSQSLLDTRLWPAARREKAFWEASASDYTNTIRTRLLLVATAYYRAVQAQILQAITEQSMQLARLEQQRAELRVQAGEARQTDLLRAQVDVARSERAFNDARNDVVISARALFRLVGLPPESTVTVVPPAPWPDPQSEALDLLIATGDRQRNDIIAARQRLTAAREQLLVTENDRLPKLDLEFNDRMGDPEYFSKGRDTWDLSVVAKWNLWDKGARRASRKQDAERIAQQVQQVAAVEKEAAGEIERALATLGTARANLQTASREEALADQNYKILSEQASHGLATALDVSTALVDLNRARTDKVRLEYDTEIAKLVLQAVIGQFPIPQE